MDSSDQPSTTNASLAVEPSNLIGSPQLDYRSNTSSCSRYSTHQRISRFILPIFPNPKFLLSSRPRYGRCQYRASNLPTIIRFLQPTDGIFIPKLLPGHTSWYPPALFADILDMIGTHVPILHLGSTHHAYL